MGGVLDSAAVHQDQIGLLRRVNNVVAVLGELADHEFAVGDVVRAAESLHVDALGAGDLWVGVLGDGEIDLVSLALLVGLFGRLFGLLLFVDFLEFAGLYDLLSGAVFELEQIIGNILDITTLVAAAHYILL